MGLTGNVYQTNQAETEGASHSPTSGGEQLPKTKEVTTQTGVYQPDTQGE